MKVLVTGSSGTVGTRLCERLLQRHQVIPVDNRPNRWNQQLTETTLLADLRDKGHLEALPQDVDVVIHCAANARVYKLVENPDLALDNLLITFNVLEFLRRSGIPRLIFTSSREVYGKSFTGSPLSEEKAAGPSLCESSYAASKLAAEALIHSYNKAYGIDYVIVRLSNVYGMYDDSDRVIPLWIRRCLSGEDIVIFGSEKELDFTYIEDAIDGIDRALERFESIRGNTINVTSGQKSSLVSVANEIRALTGSQSAVVMMENRPGEVVAFAADICRARSLLGYTPKVDIGHGIAETIRWYREHSRVFDFADNSDYKG